jgi:HAD superfamily hydrolase (TIGR01509 family)
VLNWDAIDTVLLDMDGTLLDLAFDNHFWLEHIPALYAAREPPTQRDSASEVRARFTAAMGNLEFYCIDHWSRELDLDIASLKRELAHRVALRPYVEEFLAALQQAGKRRLLVTNAHPETLAIKLERVPLAAWFDQMVVSHRYGVPKEHPQFWQRLQADYPFDVGRTLLIDDTESVLAAARDFGIAHLLTLQQPDSSRALRTDLAFPGIHHFDEIMPQALPLAAERLA